MANENVPSERSEFEQNASRLAALREEAAQAKKQQDAVLSRSENEARLMNEIFDAHGGFPKLSQEDPDHPESSVAAIRKEIRRLSLSLNKGLVLKEDDQWLNRVTPKLIALARKEDLNGDDIERFKMLYNEVLEHKETLEQMKTPAMTRDNEPDFKSSETQKYSADDLKSLVKERERIFREKKLTDEERMAQMHETDALRAQLIARDPELYTQYLTQDASRPEDAEISTRAEFDLALTVSSAHYAGVKDGSMVRHIEPIEPGTPYAFSDLDPKDAEGNFRITVEGTIEMGDKIRYNLRLHEPTSRQTGKREHAVCVDVDPVANTVRSVVIPEAIWEENPRTLLAPSKELSYLRHRAMTALHALLKKTQYIPIASTGKSVESSGLYRLPEGHETQLYERKRSTLWTHPRTIRPETLSDIEESVDGLVNSWSPEERVVLEKEGNGSVKFVLLVNYDKEDPYYEREEEFAEADNTEGLRRKLQEYFNDGATDVTLICLGAWIPPKYKNEGPGTAKKSHFRRSQGKFGLALGREDVNPQTRALQKKIKEAEDGILTLTQEEREILKRILRKNDAALNIMLTQKGIHFKDGRWDETKDSEHLPKYVMPKPQSELPLEDTREAA